MKGLVLLVGLVGANAVTANAVTADQALIPTDEPIRLGDDAVPGDVVPGAPGVRKQQLAPISNDPVQDGDHAHRGDVVPDEPEEDDLTRLVDCSQHHGDDVPVGCEVRKADVHLAHIADHAHAAGLAVLDLRPTSVRAQRVSAKQTGQPPRIFSTPLVLGPIVRTSVCRTTACAAPPVPVWVCVCAVGGQRGQRGQSGQRGQRVCVCVRGRHTMLTARC
jgi:hypothetical protein